MQQRTHMERQCTLGKSCKNRTLTMHLHCTSEEWCQDRTLTKGRVGLESREKVDGKIKRVAPLPSLRS